MNRTDETISSKHVIARTLGDEEEAWYRAPPDPDAIAVAVFQQQLKEGWLSHRASGSHLSDVHLSARLDPDR